MAWLYILIAVLAIILCALTIPASLRVHAENGGVTVSVGFLFIKKVLYPSKNAEKGKTRRKKSVKKKKSAPPTEKKAKKKLSASDVLSQIGMITSLVSEFLSRLRRHLRVKLCKLYVKIGTDEAAKTALLYGAAANVCDELIHTMREFLHFYEKPDAVDISASFTDDDTDFSADISFYLNIIGALCVILPVAVKYLKNKN